MAAAVEAANGYLNARVGDGTEGARAVSLHIGDVELAFLLLPSGPAGLVLGSLGSGGAAGEPALELRMPFEVASAIANGEYGPSVAFMRGKLKTAGENGLALKILEYTAGEEFKELLDEVKGAL